MLKILLIILQDEQNFATEDYFSYSSSTRESWDGDNDSEVSLYIYMHTHDT